MNVSLAAAAAALSSPLLAQTAFEPLWARQLHGNTVHYVFLCYRASDDETGDQQ